MDRGRGKRFKSRRKRSLSESESRDHGRAKKKNNEVISKLLPEDMIFAIFNLVPLKCLFNSARYVCKSWATIIGTSYFVETRLQHARAKPGLYVENFESESNSYFLDIKDHVNGCFERTDLGTPQRMGHLIGTCDGILLLFNGPAVSFVVNPILKCWLRIPLLPAPIYRYWNVRDQFTIARVPRIAKFKLFFVDASAHEYVFYVLRIGIDNSWTNIAEKESLGKPCILSEPIYSGGNDLYWITTDGVIVMDVDKEIIVGEYPLPLSPHPVDHPPQIQRFLWMENRFSCIVYYELSIYTIYQIYILDIYSEKWTLYREFGPFDYVAACGLELEKILRVRFRFWINNQIIFRATLITSPKNSDRNRIIHFGYNVKTRELTKIEGIGVDNFEVWLHINNLVSLPSILTS